ncbi:DeoR family transcriptional regulator [Anaerobacillus sp. 1_MG-2023]|uniref:DeoR family transcriptional regulator n=1 Tax=Bacillales TaxID=1385 RepID=UPI0026E2326F|nr:DeoR family transcriptional regulator [Anaerobacillus sp. 1_MG-2023]MDO6654321.1 DeoR family transcriptional regulator [Anaerobacillus sp. 1_MG-2023]
MLPIERKQQILTWIEKEGTLKISDISKRLSVSEMTVYRDIKPLIEESKVEKTANGIALKTRTEIPSDVCAYCLKHVSTRLSVQLIKHNQQIEHTCCAHCGLLRYRDIEKEVSQIICKDFLKDTTISAKVATYLLNAELNLNCCQPQVMAFDSLKHAKQFQSGFGGEVYTFEKAIKEIVREMEGTSCCHKN